MSQKKADFADGESSNQTVKETIAKALKRGSHWADKDDLLDVIYWGRQIFSLAIGVFWGLIPLKGIVALFLYVALSTLIGHFYLTWYQEKDDEDFGGFWEIAKEGFGAAFATFMVSWITVYSAIHFE